MDNQIEFLGKQYQIPKGYIAVCTRAVSADIPNLNGDLTPIDELSKAQYSYLGCKNVFVDHVTQDEGIDRVYTRGFVEAEGIDDTNCLCLLIMVSKEFPNLCNALLNGEINAVSMGCLCEAYCGLCGKENCIHMDYLGLNTTEGYVFDILQKVEFQEISFVFDPADPSALIWLVVDPDDEEE